MKISPLTYTIATSLALTSSQVIANDTSAIEVITVKAPQLAHSDTALAEGNLVMPDVADWLQTVPGANINKNGPITGIAQYRGMFGDRIAKNIGGHQIISAGPNAMDAPLTYINPTMVESVVVYRRIAPVSSGIDSFGGAVEVNLKQAPISDKFDFSGDLSTSFNDFNNASTLAGNLGFTAKNVGVCYILAISREMTTKTLTATQFAQLNMTNNNMALIFVMPMMTLSSARLGTNQKPTVRAHQPYPWTLIIFTHNGLMSMAIVRNKNNRSIAVITLKSTVPLRSSSKPI